LANRWHRSLLEPVEAIIPWDITSKKLIDSEAAKLANYSHLARWLKQAEALWAANRRDPEMSLTQQIDYFGKLTSQIPPGSLRVVYSKAGILSAAALLTSDSAILDHKVYGCAINDLREAHYLEAVINSEVARARVAPQQSRGQWGARDFDKLLAEAIPQFDPQNPLHIELANAAAAAEKIADGVVLPDDMHFIRARKLIRDALNADGIAQRIDALVARLLGA
jgi:hypothetical protein